MQNNGHLLYTLFGLLVGFFALAQDQQHLSGVGFGCWKERDCLGEFTSNNYFEFILLGG